MAEKTGLRVKVEKVDEAGLEGIGVKSWPIWSKDTSSFDWHYDEKEVCYFLEGEVTVNTPEGPVNFGKGDLVTFPKGLDCTWHVKKKVRKHYKFG